MKKNCYFCISINYITYEITVENTDNNPYTPPSAAYSQYTYSEQKAKERNTFSSPETTHTEPKYDWAGLIKSMDDLDIFNSVELAATSAPPDSVSNSRPR